MSKWKHDTDAEFDAGTHNNTDSVSDILQISAANWDFTEDCVDDSDWTEDSGGDGYCHDHGDDVTVTEGEFEMQLGAFTAAYYRIYRSPSPTIEDTYMVELRCNPISQGNTRDQALYIHFFNNDNTGHRLWIAIGADGVYIMNNGGSWTKHTLTMPSVMTTWKFEVTITGGVLSSAEVKIYQDDVLKATHTAGLVSYGAANNWKLEINNVNWAVEGKWRIDWLKFNNGLILGYETTGNWKTPIGDTVIEGWTSQINFKYKVKDSNYNISSIKMIAKQTSATPTDVDWDTPTDTFTEGLDYTLTKDNTYHECQIGYSTIWHTEGKRYFFYRVYMTGDGSDTPLLDWIEYIYGAIGEIPTISNIAISNSTPTNIEKTIITCDFSTTPDQAFCRISDIEEDITSGAVTFKGWDLPLSSQTVKIYSIKESLADSDTTNTITVSAATPTTIAIRNKLYDTIDDLTDTDETFEGFEIYKSFPQNKALATPCIIITLNPSPATEEMFGSDSITYLSFTLDLAFKRAHEKTVSSTLYNEDDLAQWYLDNLTHILNDIDWGSINLSEQLHCTGRTHQEFNDEMQTYLYGCSVNVTIPYKTQ
jgi:hypothetical protein